MQTLPGPSLSDPPALGEPMRVALRRAGVGPAPAAARAAASTGGMGSCRGPLPQAVQDLCDLTSGLWALEGVPAEADGAEAASPQGRALEEALQQATWADGSAVLKLLGAVEGEGAPSPPLSRVGLQVPSAPRLPPPCASQPRSAGGAVPVLDKSEILDLDLSTGGMVPMARSAAWEKCVRDDFLDKGTTMGSLPTVAAPTRDSLPWTAMTQDSLPSAAAAAVFTHDKFQNDASGCAASWDRPMMPKSASGCSLTSSMSMSGLRGGRSPSSFPTGFATFGEVVHM
ncbi:unnamed protein product [Prorocentrum cordatum]|uniref:Phospholipase B-like n=1 Tax=Prorocentrum cordatum TaxID=2364126 RepID=A0ABN9Q5F8_9DINO|nr:unnamed protein product [Polarella glacialis]